MKTFSLPRIAFVVFCALVLLVSVLLIFLVVSRFISLDRILGQK